MADRAIHIADAKGRDAEVGFFVPPTKGQTLYVDASGQKPVTRRIVKSSVSVEKLKERFGSASALGEALISGDPEIDLELVGRFSHRQTRVLVDSDGKVLYKAREEEHVFDPKGELKAKREPKFLERNIAGAEFPLRGGRLLPKKDVFNKFIFARKYQLRHVNGLTFDFLYEIAKELHEKNALMVVGGGPKGAAPLVFTDGGNPQRAFLEGRVRDNSYLLILHLSNLEMKAIPK
jgi:hypothetical protein